MKRQFEYELTITDKDYSVTYPNNVADHIVALSIARDNFSYIQDNLKKSLDQVKGKEKEKYRDRFMKITHALSAVDLILNSAVKEYKPFYDKECAEQNIPPVPSDNGDQESPGTEETSEK